MKFSDSMQNKPNTVISPLNWPRVFYDEMDAAARTDMLEEAIRQELDPENDSARQQILKNRYGKKEKNGMMPDRYMQLVLDCVFAANQNRNSARNAKRMKKTLEDLGMTAAAEGGKALRDALEEEIRHAIRLYVAICRQDRHYSSIIFGLGHMSEEALTAKIKSDIDKIAHGLDGVEEESGVAVLWRETALSIIP